MKLKLVMTSLTMLLSIAGMKAYAAEIEACKFERPSAGDLGGAKATLARLKAECVPRIQKIHTCAVRTRLLIENVEELSKTFITGDKTKPLMVDAAVKGVVDPKAVNMSLWANFSELEKDYQKSLDAIQAFVTKFKEKTDDKVKLIDFLAGLDKGYNLSAANLADLSIRENALLTFIDQAALAFEQSADSSKPEILWLASDACKDANLKPALAYSEENIKKISAKIDLMRAFIVRARNARERLIQYAYEAIRFDLTTRYRNQAVQELAALNGTIDTILQANRIMEQFELWNLRLLTDNERSSVETYWLQFEASRQINAVDYMTSKDFLERMLIATESHPGIAAPYLPKLNAFVKNAEEKIARVEKMGWSGFLARQKLLANKRLETPEKFPATCVSNFQSYLVQANAVTTIEQFRLVEPLYKAAIISCQVKK